MFTNHASFFKRSSLVLGLAVAVLFTGNVFAAEGSEQLLQRCAKVREAIHAITPSDDAFCADCELAEIIDEMVKHSAREKYGHAVLEECKSLLLEVIGQTVYLDNDDMLLADCFNKVMTYMCEQEFDIQNAVAYGQKMLEAQNLESGIFLNQWFLFNARIGRLPECVKHMQGVIEKRLNELDAYFKNTDQNPTDFLQVFNKMKSFFDIREIVCTTSSYDPEGAISYGKAMQELFLNKYVELIRAFVEQNYEVLRFCVQDALDHPEHRDDNFDEFKMKRMLKQTPQELAQDETACLTKQLVMPLMLATAEAMGKAEMSKSDVGAYLEKVFRSLAEKGFVKIESNAKGFEMTLEWDGGLLRLVSTGCCIPSYGIFYELQFRGDGHEFEHDCFDGKRKKYELPIPFYNPHFC